MAFHYGLTCIELKIFFLLFCALGGFFTCIILYNFCYKSNYRRGLFAFVKYLNQVSQLYK